MVSFDIAAAAGTRALPLPKCLQGGVFPQPLKPRPFKTKAGPVSAGALFLRERYTARERCARGSVKAAKVCWLVWYAVRHYL